MQFLFQSVLLNYWVIKTAWLFFDKTSRAYLGPVLERSTAYTDSNILSLILDFSYFMSPIILLLAYLKLVDTKESFWKYFVALMTVFALSSIILIFIEVDQTGKRLLHLYLIFVIGLFQVANIQLIRFFLKSPISSVLKK